MPGTFDKASRPVLAGDYFNWEAQKLLTVDPAVGGIVVVPATSDWGSVNAPTLLNSFSDYAASFGSSDTALQRGVYGAFKGEGRAGHGGAGAVIAVRMAASSAAAATKVLANTTPVTALTLTAKFKGTRGNAYKVTTQAGAVGGTTDLIILDGSRVVATYNFTSTSMAAAAALVNADANSPFTATVGTDGVALASVSNSSASGGLDGATLTGTEWSNLFNLLDSQRWSIVAAYGLTDGTITASLVAWIKARNLAGARAMAVIGGASGESFSTANTRSTTANEYNIVNVGGPSLHLDDLGVDAAMSEFTARVAGSIANRGEKQDLIYARFGDVSQVAGTAFATNAEQIAALGAGTTVFTKDNRSEGSIFIKEGVTTYTDDTQSTVVEGVKTHPVALYKRIKNIRIQQSIELEISDWAASGDIIGSLPVNDKTRSIVKGFITELYAAKEQQEIVSPGWTVVLDATPAPADTQDYIQYMHSFAPTRTLRQLYNTGRIG